MSGFLFAYIMKKEENLIPIIKFLIPIIFIYGIFYCLKFFEDGFLSLVYGGIILLAGVVLYLEMMCDVKIEMTKILKFVFITPCLVFLLLSLGMITDYLKL